MKRRAFISVYDKNGIVDFAKNLSEKFNYEIIASNDNYELLKSEGIEVTNVGEFSQGNSFLVKDYDCLNETIFASILADSSDSHELNDLERAVVKSFDMVVVNLRPIDEIIEASKDADEMLSKIDIAGLAVLRAAAKNYKHVTVITDKLDYYIALNANDFGRMKLASKAFNLTSVYDSKISARLAEDIGEKHFKTFNLEKIKDLPYGENPHQKAQMYNTDKQIDYEIVNGKELTFNNILNITEALNVISEFYDVNCTTIIRHTKPCGVALGSSLYDSYKKAFDCDPISSFYGVAGFTKPVTAEIARHLNSMSAEVIIAPDYEPDALKIFEDNPNIKLVKLNTTLKEYRRLTMEEVIVTPLCVLIQDKNNSELQKEMFKVVTKTKPTPEQIEDAIFAWKVVKHAKTNSAVISRDFKTFAIAQGQTNTLSAIESALNYACDGSKEAVLACDSQILSEDCIYAAVQGRISLIIQQGGSIKDQQIIETCDKYNIAMITTGIRNYRQ